MKVGASVLFTTWQGVALLMESLASNAVLIVDDSAPNLVLTAAILERAGYRCLRAENAADTISLARMEHPALVLMDMGLPDMDGCMATQALRADPLTRDIPVVMVTAYAMQADAERAIAAGCNDFLTKPIDRKLLCERIEALIAGKSE